jgi:O-antigen/teichoic acid export membrane protein
MQMRNSISNKSIGWNAALNMIRTVCRVIFPLITFPYISRVFHVDNIGIYNFCASIISYFALTANLGIDTYSVREGARLRNNRNLMNEFASEVFSINLIATIISYAVLFLCIALLPRFKTDATILISLSLSIIFTTIGCEWVFTIYEDFAYITIRSVLFQILGLILMFLFVRDDNDLIQYALISTLSSIGSNFINVFFVNRYCKIRFVLNRNMSKRLIPILFLFANSIATTIYINSDTIMLGIISGSRATGLYSVSTKIYTIVKQLLAAIIIVSIPRLSAYLGENKNNLFKKTANQIMNSLIVVVIPAMVGIFALSKDIILVISGKEYVEATSSLQILSIALFFSVFSWFYTSCILIPNREENNVLGATIIAAAVNIALNFFLIPRIQQNGAAITTVLAEFISMVICYHYGKRHFRATLIPKDIISVIFGCFGILFICYMAEKYIANAIISTILAIVVSVILYAGILAITKNKSIKFILRSLRHRE